MAVPLRESEVAPLLQNIGRPESHGSELQQHAPVVLRGLLKALGAWRPRSVMGSTPSFLRKDRLFEGCTPFVCVSKGPGADERKQPEKDLTLAD